MNRRIWLLASTAFLAALVIIGMVNAASASLPAGSAGSGSSVASLSGSSSQNVNAASNAPAPSKNDPFGIANFNCADVSRLGVDKQTNVRAAAILQKCGYSPKSSDSPSIKTGIRAIDTLVNPLLLGGTDSDVILPDGSSPHITQSETFVWAHGNTIVVNYNDSRTAPSAYTGTSYSTDGGTTWHAGQPLNTGHGTNYGDPTVVWDNNHSLWVATDLASG